MPTRRLQLGCPGAKLRKQESERLPVREPVDFEIPTVDRHDLRRVEQAGKPDQRGIGEIDVPVRISFDHNLDVGQVLARDRVNGERAAPT